MDSTQLGDHGIMGAEAERGGDYNPESAGYENSCLTTWDVGSQDKIRYAWRHLQRGSDGLIFVVDDADRDRIEGAKEELDQSLNAMTAIGAKLDLHNLGHRQ